jgi:hypothetical protein
MSLLVPFFLAGLAALSLPLLLHLVRRTPRGRQSFSSLMFLEPTPPQLTRRSRLDQVLLLLMRLGALGLATLAFARPFLRETASRSVSDLPGRRVALLVDRSASLQRTGAWARLLELANTELDSLSPQDEVALYAFDDRLETVLGFDAAPGEGGRVPLLRSRLKELQPGWSETNLGSALSSLAAELEASGDAQQSTLEPQIVLLTDLTQGSRLEALEQFEWPARVRVLVRQVPVDPSTNAAPRVLQDAETAGLDKVRVRISNAGNSRQETFSLGWFDTQGRAIREPQVTAYVPPGQSRVISLAVPPAEAQAAGVQLTGDDHDFDNRYCNSPQPRRDVAVGWLGTATADDTNGPRYYLDLALTNDPTRNVRVTPLEPASLVVPRNEPTWRLVVVTDAVTEETAARLRLLAEAGAIVLAAPVDLAGAESLPRLLPGLESAAAAPPAKGGYLLLGEIDFTHPLFAPFANPPYSDFTKIHFWQSWKLALRAPIEGQASPPVASPTVVARFDNGDPALLEERLGRGRILALGAGWTPRQSQLALSSKFVGLMGTLLDLALGETVNLPSLTTGQPLPLPTAAVESGCRVTTPRGTSEELPAGTSQFAGTETPGIYTVSWGDQAVPIAVNLSDLESQTTPLEVEQLERRGVPLGSVPPQTERLDRLRQLRDQELESRQKLWRWLLVGAMGLVILETWWAGRSERALLPAETPA